MGKSKTAWDLTQLQKFLAKTFCHELGHHISLHIVGYKRLAQIALDNHTDKNPEYERFYESEERRARKFEKLLLEQEWVDIDGVIRRGKAKVKKLLA